MKNKHHSKWLNIKLAKGKLKKSKLWQKLKNDINKNSRVFFVVSKQIDNTTVVESTLEKTKQHISPTKSKKKKIFNIVFFIVNLALVFFVFWNFANEQGGIQPLSTLFANSPKWIYLFIAMGFFFLTNIFNSLKFAVLIFSKTKKFRPLFSYKLASYGRYYDLVTPMSSGGQPFEIYYLKKNGYSGETSTAIPMAKYMIWQISFAILCTCILIAYSKDLVTNPVVLTLAWIGVGLVLIIFLFIFLMSITKKWGSALVVAVLKLLAKLKIIKNYRKTLWKVLKFVKSYQYSIKQFAKNPWTVIMSIMVTMGSLICNASVAYFVLHAFTPTPAMAWWDMVCYCTICDCSVAIIPLPGGSGASELSFNAILGTLFPIGTLFWGVLFWRIFVYYAYIPQGWIVMLIDFIKKSKIDKKTNDTIPNAEVSNK